MINTILSAACLIGMACLYIDLKIDKWEWRDDQRKKFIIAGAIGAVLFAWQATWHPILIRSAVAFGALLTLGVITLNWYQRCVKWHAIMGKSEKRQKQAICIIAILVLICMVKQIMRYKGMMF